MSERNTIGRIEGFRELQDGWHFTAGVAFEEKTINAALAFCEEMQRLGHKMDAFPGLDGQIVFARYNAPHYREFVIYPDEHVDFLYEIGDEEIEERLGINMAEAYVILGDIPPMLEVP